MFDLIFWAGKRILITGTGKRARRSMGAPLPRRRRVAEGTGQFSFLQEMLSKADWQALRPKESG